jgi:hypothetical protein
MYTTQARAGISSPILNEATVTVQPIKVWIWLLLLLGSVVFVIRGPLRVVERSGTYNDYTSTYVGAKAWIRGLNPYSNAVFWQLWEEANPGAHFSEEESIGSRTPYPWTCFLILGPLSLLNPSMASAALGLISSALLVLSIWLLSRLPEITSNSHRWIFIALSLMMAPLASGLGQMNISMLAIACIFLSFWSISTQKPIASGIWCALALCLKPPIGAFFLLYYIVSREWKAFATAILSGGVLAGIAIGRLELAGVPWLSSYIANSKLVITDPMNVITAANPRRFQMLNLQVLWYSLVKNQSLANAMALAVAAALLIVVCSLLIRRKAPFPRSLAVAALSVTTLLPLYHRFYDASLLIFVLSWALSSVSNHEKGCRDLVLFLLVPFFVPGAWALENLQNENRIPHFLTNRWWWEPFVLGHEIWAILLLALTLTAATWIYHNAESPTASGLSSSE